ncbi:MAG: hypothetical protein NWF05_00860 [Candidatus Bathyarchaeota archaeon]|nr:hypothetical protein [Candidatus Bathyarchaeota archaeon]
MKFATVTTISVAVILAIFGLVLPVYAVSTWSVQTVDAVAVLSGGLALALDSNGNPHMVYVYAPEGSSQTGGHVDVHMNPQSLTYASWNGKTWEKQAIDYFYIANLSTQVVFSLSYSSLKLDPQNNPHLVYSIPNPNSTKQYLLKYACWTGSAWSIQTVDYGIRGALALDSFGKPHIVYSGADGQLSYASWNGSAWATQIVDPQSSRRLTDINNLQYLALDSAGRPYIVYEVGAVIKFATNSVTGWTIDTLLTGFDTTAFPLGNIVLDSMGYPHFSCGINDWVMYVSWNGSAWNSQKVVSGIGFSHGTFLVLDKNDTPHITFANSSGYVGYARWTGTSWFAQFVAHAALAGNSMPLALDSAGNPHIAYLDVLLTYYFTDGKIMYTTGNQSLQTPTPAPTETAAPTPSLSIPEISPLVTLPLLALTAVVVVIVKIGVRRLRTET